MNIADNLLQLKKSIPGHVVMVTVSKQQPVTALMEAYQAGQRIFGENKVQELVAKQQKLPSDIEWHFIGHLQTNKVRFLAPCVSLIHSIDRLNLLMEVNKEALKHNRIIDCLLQFHIATEETKFGMDIGEAKEILESKSYREMKNIRITGVMGMSSFSDDMALVRQEFKNLHDFFLILKTSYFKHPDTFNVVSMGMSGDYLIAIDEGSTMVRIGTAIFGERHYE
ncbi:MAG: YggS family pyridoxal phosphate-dependent enzyme [Bacteroidota bacterium]